MSVTGKLQEKCPVCSKVAKISSVVTRGSIKVITLECNHIQFVEIGKTSPFESITFDGDATCKHEWGKGSYRTVCIKCSAKKLYEFQIEGAKAIERANGRFAILDEMGLGKGIQALSYLKFHPEALPFLWITKSKIKFQHVREIRRILGDKAFPQILTNGKEILFPGLNCVASYDILRRFGSEMFQQHGFQCVILDECQAVANVTSTRTQVLRAIVRDIPRIIPTSGTFWKNRGSEAFVMLNMLDPKRFHNFKRFKDTEVQYLYDPKTGKYKEGGLRDKFITEIDDIAIRRLRKEVMPELPSINRTKLVVEVPEHARIAYNKVQDELTKIYNDALQDGSENSFKTQADLMASLMMMRQIVGIAKVPATVEFACEFLESTDEKLVIFAHHIECRRLIYEQLKTWCKENGELEPLLTGDGDIQQKFNSDKYRVLIASSLSDGEGLNLQICSNCILHERQWNPGNEEQQEGRFIRIGSKAFQVNATYVHGFDTVDTDMDEIVEPKRMRFEISMNKDGVSQSWHENDLVQELVKKIASRKKK